MPTDIEYALLSTRVYDASDINRTGIPAGWTELTWQADYNSSGFSAGAYRNGSEVVIAYAGTNQTLDWLSNFLAGTGILPAPQLFDAMRFYLDAKAANTDATSFTFTGHSLGGGLASLMAVFFDKQATVFDEAPFQLSAINPVLLSALEASLLLNGYTDLDFALYNASFGALFQFREENVRHIYLAGEELGEYRNGLTTIVGSQGESSISMGNSTLDARNRHAMTLLTAMLGNTVFASVVRELPDLASYLLDPNWFGVADRRTVDKLDLLSRLIRSQYGAEGSPADGRLDRFAADMLQLIGTSGVVQTSTLVRDALMIASMEYFHTKATSPTADKLFTVDGNGLHFKYSDIGATSYKSLPLLARAVESLLGPDGVGAYDRLVTQNAWHIQSGAGSMVWTASGTENDAAVGGAQADTLYGGAGVDTLYGGDGADTLVGGAGADLMIGGAGIDTYFIEGNDTIQDSGSNFVVYQGKVLAGAFLREGTSNTYRFLSDNNITLTFDSAAHLTVNGTDSVNFTKQTSAADFENGDFGISLVAEGTDPATATVISGDLAAKWFVGYTSDNVPYHYHKWDELGNIITEGSEPGREDYLYDSAGNDRLEGLAGNDFLDAYRGGDDIVDGGVGDDEGYGGAGKDLLLGCSGSDAMVGGADDDRLYADQEQEISVIYLAGETGEGTGARGDLLSGDGGDDQLYGGAGNDILAGGAGSDVIYGGAGDDTIEGDQGFLDTYVSWGVTRTVTQGTDYSLYTRAYKDAWGYEAGSTEQGDDTIYAGAGADWVFAQGGNDFVDAGSGDDVVFGDSGDDIILGQAGNDVLNGDDKDAPAEDHGDDYLDGGDGNDKMWGHGGTDILFGGAGDDELSGDSSVTPVEIQGDDYLDGGDGNDRMWGHGGADILIGGAGDDQLYGDSSGIPFVAHGDDYLDGGEGNDILVGSGGADTLLGGRDDDELYGDSSDTPAEAHGNDYLDGGEGNDTLVGSGGADILLGGAGDDQLHGDSSDTPLVVQGDDYLDGGDGNDYLGGYDGDDTLLGGAGDDTLYGQEGNDYLDGGAGIDYLDGGSGDDTYIFATGDGPLIVSDWFMTVEWIDDRQGLNALVLPSGYPLQLYYDDYGLTLQYGLGDYLYLNDGIMQASHYNVDTGAGAVSLRSLIAQQIDVPLFLEGSAADDVLQGGRGDDVLLGNDGDDLQDGAGGGDLLYGGAGNDTLWGGDGIDNLFGEAGNDTLLGGAGNDTYNFSAGGGSDSIIDTSGDDQLVFGAGILASGVAASRTGSQVTLAVSATDSITFDETAPGQYAVETMLFEDGTVWQAAEIQQRLNAVPTGSVTVSGVATQGQTLTVTSNLADADGLGAIGYQWQSSTDGTIWNDIGGATADSFILGEAQVGEQLRAVAGYTDGYGTVESVTSTATAAIANVNDVPTGSVTISGAAAQGQTLTASNDLSDIDGLGAIGYQWQSSTDGTIWSDIGGATANSFALGEAQVGAQVRAMAGYTDGHGTVESVASTATAVIGGVNNAPNVAIRISTELATEDAAFSFTIPVETFTDGDAGDSLTNTASLSDASALPYWLNFDAATRTFSGTPDSTAAGLWDVRVTATDKAGAGVSDDFVLDVANHLVGTETKDRLRGTTLRDVIEGLGGNDTLKGGVGNDTLYGGDGSDTLYGGDGNDTYMFNLGDGSDIINNYDPTGFDTVSFGDNIGQNSVGLFRNGNNLEIGYSDADMVSISKYFFNDKYMVDEIALTDGSYLTAADINQLVQDIAAYAVNEGIALTSVNDVRNNEQLMSMVANSWHA